MTLDEIRQRVWEAMERAQDQKLRIGRGTWGLRVSRDNTWEPDAGGVVCPLGAFMLGRERHRGLLEDTADALGVDLRFVNSFMYGVDRVTEPSVQGQPGRLLGRDLMEAWEGPRPVADWPKEVVRVDQPERV